MNYEIYICDTETTGLNVVDHSPIEISIIRLSTNEQKTWNLKAINYDKIDLGALKINGHKLEDITHKTEFGIKTYLQPEKTIIEIENWLAEDNLTSGERVLCGQNIAFDKYMLEFLWRKLNSYDSFPFGRRTLDTFQIEFLYDYVNNSFSENYSLAALTKKYGLKNAKAHSAEADTKVTKELFEHQIKFKMNKLKDK